jgi:hypothetical protein
MVTELQFVAVAAFLIWGLVSSLCGVLTAAPDTARLVWHHRSVRPETSDVAPEPRTVASADPSLETHAK